jgi:hypothetical protein
MGHSSRSGVKCIGFRVYSLGVRVKERVQDVGLRRIVYHVRSSGDRLGPIIMNMYQGEG